MKPKKKLIHLLIMLLGTVAFQSCTKQNVSPGTTALASLNIINALPKSDPLIPVVGTTGPIITYALLHQPQNGSFQNFKGVGAIGYATNALLNPNAGQNIFYLVQKNADTLLNSQGTVRKTMYSNTLDLAANSAYSLFITGPDTTASDYLLVQDVLPFHVASDQTVGIRFVNLSSNSNPVSVNIKGSANGSEVPTLAYKAITQFKNYAADASVSSYIFEVRDATSGTLLTSYTLSGVNGGSTTVANTVRYKNLTIALIGQPAGGAFAQKCILINNY